MGGRTALSIPSQTQLKLLRYLVNYLATHPYPPTLREIGGVMGVSSSAIHSHLKKLKKLGYIDFQPHTPRSLSITPKVEDLV